MILLPKVPERADNQWGTLPFVEAGHISHTGISQKEPSSFRTHGKPFIILLAGRFRLRHIGRTIVVRRIVHTFRR